MESWILLQKPFKDPILKNLKYKIALFPYTMKKRHTSCIFSLFIILALGALVGMLFSPSRGTTTRSLILYKLKRIFEKIKLLFLELIAFPRQVETYNGGKMASQEVINQTIQKAKKLLEEAEELSGQLDANNPTT